MDYFLAGATSLEALRAIRSSDLYTLDPEADWRACAAMSAPRMRDLAALRAALPERLANARARAPVDLTYFSRDNRPATASINAFTYLSEPSKNAFVELCEVGGGRFERLGVRIFLESPGLTFLRMAQRLSSAVTQGKLSPTAATARLIGFGSELCGSYVRDPTDPIHGPCAYGVDALCHANDLFAFATQVMKVRGIKLARSAAEFVRDGSGSPAETLLALAMALPPRLGGAGLPDFVQNQPIALDGQPGGLIHHRTMRPDFYWPLHRVAAEYNGRAHDSETSHEEDHYRRQDYATLGIDLLEARHSDIKDACSLERFIKLVAIQLAPAETPGFLHRIDSALTRQETRTARAALISQLSAGARASHS